MDSNSARDTLSSFEPRPEQVTYIPNPRGPSHTAFTRDTPRRLRRFISCRRPPPRQTQVHPTIWGFTGLRRTSLNNYHRLPAHTGLHRAYTAHTAFPPRLSPCIGASPGLYRHTAFPPPLSPRTRGFTGTILWVPAALAALSPYTRSFT